MLDEMYHHSTFNYEGMDKAEAYAVSRLVRFNKICWDLMSMKSVQMGHKTEKISQKQTN